MKKAPDEPITVDATVYFVTSEFVIAACVKQFLYYYPLKQWGYEDPQPGDLVRVYHTGGYRPEVCAMEPLNVDSEPS